MINVKRKWITFWVVNAFALVSLLVVVSGHTGGVLGAVFGVVFVLLLPGYVLVAALVGTQIDIVERITLSIAMSIAIIIAGGFALNALPAGLQARSWAIFVWLAVSAGATILLYRSLRQADALLRAAHVPMPRRRDVGFLIASLLVISVAIGVAVHSAQAQQSASFTQLWMLPEKTRQTTGQAATVSLGVRNEERTRQSYQLDIRVNGAVTHTYRIQLNPGQEWQQRVAIALGDVRGSVTIDAMLFRPTLSKQPYRQVRLFLTTG